MKFNFDIDCTPAEARAFLGLPDVAAMQDRMMKDVEKRLKEMVQVPDPETFLKTWLPAGMQGWEQMQKAFWGQMGQPDKPAKPGK